MIKKCTCAGGFDPSEKPPYAHAACGGSGYVSVDGEGCSTCTGMRIHQRVRCHKCGTVIESQLDRLRITVVSLTQDLERERLQYSLEAAANLGLRMEVIELKRRLAAETECRLRIIQERNTAEYVARKAINWCRRTEFAEQELRDAVKAYT